MTAVETAPSAHPKPGTWLPRRVTTDMQAESLLQRASRLHVAWEPAPKPGDLRPHPVLHALRMAPLATTIDLDLVSRLIRERRRERRKGDEEAIEASLRALSQDGYKALIGDLFRREGYEVLAAEGPDEDVIDLEIAARGKHWLVNTQLRHVDMVEVPPLMEMAKVVRQNNADGAFVFTDGQFQRRLESFAQANGLVLIDGDLMVNIVIEMALEDARKENLSVKLERSLNPNFGREIRRAILVPTPTSSPGIPRPSS